MHNLLTRAAIGRRLDGGGAWDAIVVGGGLAGLAAAAWIARGGRRVIAIERARAPGGRAATQDRDGFLLNVQRGPACALSRGRRGGVRREIRMQGLVAGRHDLHFFPPSRHPKATRVTLGGGCAPKNSSPPRTRPAPPFSNSSRSDTRRRRAGRKAPRARPKSGLARLARRLPPPQALVDDNLHGRPRGRRRVGPPHDLLAPLDRSIIHWGSDKEADFS